MHFAEFGKNAGTEYAPRRHSRAGTNDPHTILSIRSVISPETLESIWNQHANRLVLIARSIGEPAEDAVQEAFISLALQREVPINVVAWMVRVIRNQILSWRRAGTNRQKREEAVSNGRDWFSPTVDPLSTDDLMNGLQQLPDLQRQLVVMHHWGELTFDQIAEILGNSRSTLHREYQSGMAALRKHFEISIEK